MKLSWSFRPRNGSKEEELKSNEIELVIRTEKYEQVQAEVELLKRELAQFHVENKSLQTQLNEAKEEVGTTAAKAVSEYQSLAEMAALRQTIRDEAFEEAMESFTYTTEVQHPNWDLSYLGDHLAAQIVEWHAKLPVELPLAEDHPAVLVLPVEEVQEGPQPILDGFPEQVIKPDQEPVIRPAESDASLEQIDNPYVCFSFHSCFFFVFFFVIGSLELFELDYILLYFFILRLHFHFCFIFHCIQTMTVCFGLT